MRPFTVQQVEHELATPSGLSRQRDIAQKLPDGVLMDWTYVAPPSPFPVAGMTLYASAGQARKAAAAHRSDKPVDGGFCGNCRTLQFRNVELVIPTGVVPHLTARQADTLETELVTLGAGG